MFSFLGIPIGDNPKRVAAWKPLLEKGRANFSCWKGGVVSVGCLNSLMQVLANGVPLLDVTDKVIWILDPKVGYSIKSDTIVLEKGKVEYDVDFILQKAYCSL
ncbi:hypothetical protein KIW84_063893 [Lathyrus oleraceus]|uniref:Uncharacterized protein n=1 Tax=Pisum sativum TaxID=3888 RepID=A0A9D5A5E7_PEA|nr:hypothetical protein KIW84_063893 [Pisum sativum]